MSLKYVKRCMISLILMFIHFSTLQISRLVLFLCMCVCDFFKKSWQECREMGTHMLLGMNGKV